MSDNEKLSSELTLLKTELRETIKQNARIKSQLGLASKDNILKEKENQDFKARL